MSDDRLKALEMQLDEYGKRLQIAEEDNTNLCTIMRFMAGSNTTFYSFADAADKAINKEGLESNSYVNLDVLYTEIIKIRTMLRSVLGEHVYDDLDRRIEEILPIKPDMDTDPTKGLARQVSMLIHPDIKRSKEGGEVNGDGESR